MQSPIKTIAGGTEFVPIAVFNIEKTITNLKKLVIHIKTKGNKVNIAIVNNNCKTGFISFKSTSINNYPFLFGFDRLILLKGFL